MDYFKASELKKLYKSPPDSHKGENGRLTIVGGSNLFHGASLWALKVASRIVDMVFYASVPQNNELTKYLKGNLYDFIAVKREDLDSYIEESDAILIGPGLPRAEGQHEDEKSSRELTEKLLSKFPEKKWVIDAGSLTEMDPEWLSNLSGRVILTPHQVEFKKLFNLEPNEENALKMSKEFGCIILLKGVEDIVCQNGQGLKVKGGNQGMTKGGTGDVLSGLVAALACKNDLFLAACAGSFINKMSGDILYEKVGTYYNTSDLSEEIPQIMHKLIT